jgi:hypothetical protein
VLRSIKELEFDFAMGKVAQADFDEMSTRLRQRAIGLMRQLDEGGGYREQIAREIEHRLANDNASTGSTGSTGSTSSTSSTCECGTANDADARFCKNCGAKLS